MQINKIVPELVDIGISKLQKPGVQALQAGRPQVTDAAIKTCSQAQANIAKAGIRLNGAIAIASSKHIAALPEFIYHLTDETALEKILHSEIKLSTWEKGSEALPGIYMIDKQNFLNAWIKKQDSAKDIFGDVNLGGLLLGWMQKDNGSKIASIEIPTSALDMSKLRFRPYIESCAALITDGDKTIATKGLPLEELAKWKSKNVPLEYVYTDAIPSNLIHSVRKVDLNLPKADCGYDLTQLMGYSDFVEDVSSKLFAKK